MNLKTVIGIEMHTALNTKTKIFSNSLNTYSNTPNMAVSNIDLAHPGTLPYLNKETVYKAITMALSLNCEVADTLIFDRKCYFYPDLAKGYQITQDTLPIGLSGNLDIEVGNRLVNIKIADIHLEEDTASLDHFNDYSLLDFNRAGTPLLEIVTEPCISSADEAVAFLEQVRNIYKYTGVSNADTKKGEVRCDLNISMHEEGSSTFGTRVEIKNVNSFSNVRDAINYEIKRQSDLIKSGNKEKIIKETRRWDEEKEMTVCMREKSDALDYRFHVDPNIPKIKIDNDLIILDDVGNERLTEWSMEHLYNLFNFIYTNKKPLIINTNLSLFELEEFLTIKKSNKLTDRISELCKIFHFDWESRRSELNKEIFKELF